MPAATHDDTSATRSAQPERSAPSRDHRADRGMGGGSIQTGSHGPSTVGNGVMSRAMSGGSLGGLGAVLRQEQAFAAAGMQTHTLSSNTAMLRAMRRERARDGNGVSLQAATPLRRAQASAGAALDPVHRARFEAAFDHDFSHVRVHADGSAHAASEALSAHAFAVGADLFFAAGAFAPGTPRGDRLLAHELTHVVQHDEGRLPSATGDGLDVSSPDDPHEREAYGNEARIVAGLDSGPSEVGGQVDAASSSEAGAAISRAGAPPSAAPLAERILDSRGEALDPDAAEAVRAAIDADASHLIIHRDRVAAQVGERVGRAVYSIGWHIFLADGQSLDAPMDETLRTELLHAATSEPAGEEARLAATLDGETDLQVPSTEAEAVDPDHLPGVTDRTNAAEQDDTADAEQAEAAQGEGEEEEEDNKDKDKDKDKDKEQGEPLDAAPAEAELTSNAPTPSTMPDSDGSEIAPSSPTGTLAELSTSTLRDYLHEKSIHHAWTQATRPAETSTPSGGDFAQATLEGVADGAELAVMQLALGQVGIGMGPGGRPAMNLKAGEGLAGGKNFAGGFLVLGHMAMVGPEQWFADMGANTLGKGREGVEKLFGEDSDLITRIAGFIDIADAVNNAILYASYIAQAIAAVCFALAAALSSNPFTAGLAPAMLAIANFAVTVGDILATVNTVFGLVIMGLRAIHVLAQALRLAIEDADPATQAERVLALQDSVGGLASELTQRAVLGAAAGGGASEFGTADNHTAAFRDQAQTMMDEVAAGGSVVEAEPVPTLEELGIPEGVELPAPPVEQEQVLDRAAVGIATLELELTLTEQLATGVSSARHQVDRESAQIEENQGQTQLHHEAIQAQMAELEHKRIAAEKGRETTETIEEEGRENQGTASELLGLMGSAVSMLLSLFGMAPSDAGDSDADTGSLEGGAEDAMTSSDPVPGAASEATAATQTAQAEIEEAAAGTEAGREHVSSIEARLDEEAALNREQAGVVEATEGDAQAHIEALTARRDAQLAEHAEALGELQDWAEVQASLRLPEGIAQHLDRRLGSGEGDAGAPGPSELDVQAEAVGGGAFDPR